MENLLSSISSAAERRILVLIKDKNGDSDWIDAAEFAQLAGITTERYPFWLNLMLEMGSIAVSDRLTH